MFSYVLDDNNNYQLINRDTREIIFSCGPEIAVCFSFDGEHSVMHKHGTSKKIYQWFSKANRKYLAAGLGPDFKLIHGAIPLDVIDKTINNTGWLDLYIKKTNLADAIKASPKSHQFRLVKKDGWEGWIAEDFREKS